MTSITNISAKSSFSNATNSTLNKLIYRGNSYEVPAPIPVVSNSTTQPKIKLIYRGNTFDYTPLAVEIEEIKTDCPTVSLMYRGNIYERKLRPSNTNSQKSVNTFVN
jgi:hypothetical protein